MPVYEVFGKHLEKGTEKSFKKSVRAVNENFAAEKVMALMGSKHRLKRRQISINDVREVKGSEERGESKGKSKKD